MKSWIAAEIAWKKSFLRWVPRAYAWDRPSIWPRTSEGGGGLVDCLVAHQRPCDLAIRKFLNLKMNLDELYYNTKLYNLKSFVWNHRNQATIFISSLNDTLEMREISSYICCSFNSFCCNVDVTFILAYPSPRADMIPSTFFFWGTELASALRRCGEQGGS